MHLIRDLLDKQLVDRAEEPIGRVDGIVVELRDDGPPRVIELQLGFVTLARRVGTRTERWTEALHRRWSVRRSARHAIPWAEVQEVHMRHIKVKLEAQETAAFDWERWWRRRVIGRIPGSGKNE